MPTASSPYASPYSATTPATAPPSTPTTLIRRARRFASGGRPRRNRHSATRQAPLSTGPNSARPRALSGWGWSAAGGAGQLHGWLNAAATAAADTMISPRPARRAVSRSCPIDTPEALWIVTYRSVGDVLRGHRRRLAGRVLLAARRVPARPEVRGCGGAYPEGPARGNVRLARRVRAVGAPGLRGYRRTVGGDPGSDHRGRGTRGAGPGRDSARTGPARAADAMGARGRVRSGPGGRAVPADALARCP